MLMVTIHSFIHLLTQQEFNELLSSTQNQMVNFHKLSYRPQHLKTLDRTKVCLELQKVKINLDVTHVSIYQKEVR